MRKREMFFGWKRKVEKDENQWANANVKDEEEVEK